MSILTHQKFGQARIRRSPLVSAGVAAIFATSLVSCSDSGDGSGSGSRVGESASTAAPSEASSAPALEGTWRTGPVSPADAEATLRTHGLEKWLQGFRASSPIGPETVLTLEIGDGGWDLYGSSAGAPRETIDYADYRVSGDEVAALHDEGTNTYAWSVEGDTLTLRWLSTTFQAYDGVPEEVFQRALYMTADFTRVGS